MEENWVKQYTELRPRYYDFTIKVKGLIEELLKSSGIHFHLIEHRTKEIVSFQEKIKRKQSAYESISDITDLSGLRIIMYYPEDIEKAIPLIRSEFRVDDKNSIVKGEEFNPNEFGYKSFHLVSQISKTRAKLAEWKLYDDFKCEIQVRTVLQHAWASISHTLQYKSTHDIPKSLQRKLFRLAGLFELADEQFSEINQAHLTLRSQIQEENIETSTRDLNLLSVEQFLKKSKAVKRIYEVALAVGFIDQFEDSNIEGPSLTDSISNLISLCEHFQIESIMMLERAMWVLNHNDLKNYLNKQFNNGRNPDNEWYVSEPFIVTLIVLKVFRKKVDLSLLERMGWDKSIAQNVIANLL